LDERAEQNFLGIVSLKKLFPVFEKIGKDDFVDQDFFFLGLIFEHLVFFFE
jgi:hypothetical protein